MLNGYKTYILASVIAGLTFAHYVGWVSTELYQSALGFLGAGGLITSRLATGKVEKVQVK